MRLSPLVFVVVLPHPGGSFLPDDLPLLTINTCGDARDLVDVIIDEECAVVRRAAEAAGARCAESKHWELGGDGALEFADAVVDACNEKATSMPSVLP